MRIQSLFIVLVCFCLSAHGLVAQDHDHNGGEVAFEISCSDEAQKHFEAALEHLHHMMYEQARPVFEEAIAADPACAMAHWGVAMTSFQPLWHPTPDEGLARGKASVAAAQALAAPTEREQAFIDAVEAFFTDPDPPIDSRAGDHEARLQSWKEAQRAVHEAYPDDVDAAAFYALASISHAQTQFSPYEERDLSPNIEAGELLEEFFDAHPEHPGLFHYLIHAYDNPELAHKAEEAARGYDQIAPETVHALHMPSHIFVRMGKWEETIEWNKRSADAALAEMEVDPHASAHYVHALDYIMYGQLQLGDEEGARETFERIREAGEIYPAPFAGYNTAAPQARYVLERQQWDEAANLEVAYPDVLPWDNYPAATALFHYARGLGAARTGDLEQAEVERDHLADAVRALRDAGDTYWAYMTEALGNAVEAWILYEQDETEPALELMREAADLEDSMDKHPTSPGEVLPVRELYGELLLQEGQYEAAKRAFEQSLERTPNRKNARRGLDQIAGAY